MTNKRRTIIPGNRTQTAITPKRGPRRNVIVPPLKKGGPAPPVDTALRFDNPEQGGKEVLDQGTEVFSGQPVTGDFPRLGIVAQGGWGESGLDTKPGGMPGRMSRIADHDVAIVSPWRQWVYAGSTGPAKDRTDICAYIKSFNPNIILYCYTLEATDLYRTSQLEPAPTQRDKWDQETWYLYDGTGTTFPDDCVVPGGPFPDWQSNHSNFAPADSAGVTPAVWAARSQHANSTDSGDWVTAGWGLRAEYDFDGFHQDILRYEPRVNGDWNRDGSIDAKEGSIARDAKAFGDQAYHAEWALLEPSFLTSGNHTQNAGVNGSSQYRDAVAQGYKDFTNGAMLEATMGRSSSIETFGGWDAMMRYYKRAMTLVENMNPSHVFFDNWEVDGFSEDDPNIWDATHSIYEWGRYGLCSCLQDDGYYGFPTSGGFVDANILDEYSFNLGARIGSPNYDGTDPAFSDTGSGYIAYQNGVYLSEFENGLAIVNPKNNNDQTITLPSAGAGFRWDRLNAADYDNQEPSVNDGATNITTQFLEERKGIILKRTAI